MLDVNQLLERYRLLTRDVQNGLQNAERQVEGIRKSITPQQYQYLSETLTNINDSWQDFAGWILVSTLDDLEEAKKNCAPGRLDVDSKLKRSKLRRKHDLNRSGITVDMTEVESITIESYIPYFEQLLDLLMGNAIKYSPNGGDIQLCAERHAGGCRVTITSVGPLVQKHELNLLGNKGFRSDAARKTNTTGDGYGLYNVKRLANLLHANLSIKPETRVLYNSGAIPMATFKVSVTFPEGPRYPAPSS